MPQCQNITRFRAENWHENLDPETWAWISIGEPELVESFINNRILDALPNLKLSFWDTVETVYDILGAPYHPPSEKDAARIVDFLVKNRGKNFLINCAAGISRSGAICAFLEKVFSYEWEKEGKTRTYKKHGPNKLLVRMMKDYYYA
jgi:predicted protein tyrosine phosphatase